MQASSWIEHPTILKGGLVELIPFAPAHYAELELLAKDKRIWEYLPTDCSDSEKFSKVFADAFHERGKGVQYPFAIFHKKEGKLIGSTRFLDINPNNRKLEIGYTWLHPDYWATAINFECKLLLLTFCFETLKTVRVQIKTSDTNLRSQKAIEKIGARFEGILRKDLIRDNGTARNSVYYSIIDEEWSKVKEALERRLEKN